VTVTYTQEVWGEAFLTDDPSISATTTWQTLLSPGAKRKYIPTSQLKRWMHDPQSCPNAATYTDNFYAEFWKHRTKVIQVPTVSQAKLTELATQYMDDILKQSTTQKATVVMEPQMEIGDTVKVVDVSGALVNGLYPSYNRTIVGFEDGDSWDNPSQTILLADFS